MRGRLTSRQEEIVALLAQGCNGPEVARRLCLSRHTVRTHIGMMMTTLDAKTQAHAVAIWLTGHD